MASHAIRLFQSGAHQRKESYSLIFLDLREAFYRVIRPLITGSRFNDESFAQVAAVLQLPADTLSVLHRHLQEDSLPALAGASQWASLSLSEILDCTWFRFRGGPKVVETGVGSRPGDNCADLVFSYLFACVLRDLRQELCQQGVLTQLPWAEPWLCHVPQTLPEDGKAVLLPILDATWMDDLSLMVRATRANRLVEATQTAAGSLIDQCLSRGLIPNLSRGKTEIILVPFGVGSRSVRAEVFRDTDPCLPVFSHRLPQAEVRLVGQYRHLGGLIHHTGKVIREVRHRIMLAHEAFQRHKKRVFGSPAVSFQAKAVLYESLILSVLLHGAGTWIGLDDKARLALNTAHTHMVARMLRPRYSFDEALHLGPERILAIFGVPSMSVLLHVARLRQLVPSIRLRIREFWALVHWNSTWLGEVRGSIEWLSAMVSPDADLWTHTWPSWQATIEHHPGRWKALLRRAQGRAMQQEAWHAARMHQAGLMVRQLQVLGALLDSEALDATDRHYCCAPCQCVFDSYNKWSLHAFKKHGRVMQGRGLLQGSQCQACLRHFRTNVRLCRHLRFTPSCRLKLQQAGYACELEPGVGSRRAPDPAGSQAPVLQASGPCMPLQFTDIVEERQRPVAEILDCLLHMDFDGHLATCSSEELWSRIRLSFSCVCASTDRLRHTVRAWAQVVDDTPIDLRCRLRPCLERLSQTDLVQWLVPVPLTPTPRFTTFRDGELTLSMLDKSTVRLPPSAPSDNDLVVVAGPRTWERRALSLYGTKLLFFPHEDTIDRLAAGLPPEYMEGPFEELRFVLTDEGLGQLSGVCPRSLPPSRFQTCLNKASLAGDLLRLFLRLLAHGVPAYLLTSGPSDLCRSAVTGLHEVSSTQLDSQLFVHMRAGDCPDLFHLFKLACT